MKRREADFELPEDMSSDEFQEIVNHLHKYEVKLPDEVEINRTVEAVRVHMNVNNKHRSSEMDRISQIFRFALSGISFFSPVYWIVSIALYLAGVLFFVTGQNPYFIVLALSPIPFILGIIEVFRSRDEGMMELEMSFKFNAASVMLSKLLVIAVFNILLNSIISVYFYFAQETLNLFQITIYWLTPFSLVCGLSLMMALRFRSTYTTLCLMPIWIIICLSILSVPSLKEQLITMNTAAYLVFIGLGIVFTCIQVSRLISKTQSYFERNVPFEINYS
jgi:hypothetical protein